MKSYNQKSNAKRAASSLAAKFPSFTMTDPVPADTDGEWFPALMTTKATIREGVPAEIIAAAYVNGSDISVAGVDLGGEPMVAPEALPAETHAAINDAVKTIAAKIVAGRKPKAKVAKVKAEKPAKAPKAASKGATVLDMVKREGGALASEMMAATGWQAHTLRAFLSRAKAEHGITSERTPDGSRYTSNQASA